MPQVHRTAIVEDDVTLAPDVIIGPWCVLQGKVAIGAGTRLIGNAWVQGPIDIGETNLIYPFACLGFSPQHLKWDPQTPGRGVRIGDRNIFREGVTVHRAFFEHGPTTLGNDNFFMTNSHVGHDTTLGDNVTLVSGALLGGHVAVEDRVIVGGGSVVHQFVRLGRGCMLGGGVAAAGDVPPWFLVTGHNFCGSVNLVGLRRSGLPKAQIDRVRAIHRKLYRSERPLSAVIEELRGEAQDDVSTEFLRFFQASTRAMIPGRAQASRGGR